MFMLEYKDVSWWYWLATAGLLTIGLSGNPKYFYIAISLTIIQLIHFTFREGQVSAFPVQVRLWYLLLLVIALPEQMQMVYWVPMIGTWAQVIFGYCTMARCVSLFPWNRTEDFSFNLVRITFLSRPVRGNFLQGFVNPK